MNAPALATEPGLPVLSVQEIMDLPKANLSPLQITLLLARHEMRTFANYLATSDMVPKAYIQKPGNVMVALSVALRFNLDPLSVMEGLAVINGQPSFYGDLLLAVCMAHPDFEDIDESHTGEGDDLTATCVVKRRGRTPKVGTFSVREAREAKLLEKAGPWMYYKRRMTRMRARAFALRDQFADILKGIGFAEEQADVQMTRSVDRVGSGKVTSLSERLSRRASAVQGEEPAPAPDAEEGQLVEEQPEEPAQAPATPAESDASGETQSDVDPEPNGGSNTPSADDADQVSIICEVPLTDEQRAALRTFIRRRVNGQLAGIVSSAEMLDLARKEIHPSIASIDALTEPQAGELILLLQAAVDRARGC